MQRNIAVFAIWMLTLPLMAAGHGDTQGNSEKGQEEFEQYWVQVSAKDKFDRSKLADIGMTVEVPRTGSVWGFADAQTLKQIEKAGFKVIGKFKNEVGKGGHHIYDFPSGDQRFHNYAELKGELEDLNRANPDISKLIIIGKSVEGREILALHINTDPTALETGKSDKPGSIYLGAHHAREHLSVEVPLMFAQYLMSNQSRLEVKSLVNTRDIWIVPMVNPDGAEYDIATGRYQLWRKNRKKVNGSTYGVDLNRNYGYKWGTGGSSTSPSNDTYMGTQPFSEPETQAVRDLVKGLPNVKTLLTFHTFSELVLYPWGHSYDPVAQEKDRQVFEKMATTMAGWNGYTPQQASDLYIASGDTTDWAYGELGIFAFTFELSPKNSPFMDPGKGFYPGAGVIEKVFKDNILPCLYLLDAADNPYKVLELTQDRGYLTNYIEPTYEAAAQLAALH